MTGVLVVTASIGAGHTEAAGELARQLGDRGVEVDVIDVLALAGKDGEKLRRTYRRLLAHAPWVYDIAMRCWARYPAPLERFVARRSDAAERALVDAVRTYQPDVIATNYNLAGQALGRLKARGEITTPVATVVTDPGAHPYWVSKHVELHIAPLETTAVRLGEFGAPRVAVSPPLVHAQFRNPVSAPVARERLGLPEGALALVSAGSWAAGRVLQTAAVARSLPELHVTVLCAHDEMLRHSLIARGIDGQGWTDDVAGYLAAADVLVDNAGGLTCWEAIACGTPVVCYDPLPGHGRINVAALARAGLVQVARNPGELQALLRDVGTQPAPQPFGAGAPFDAQAASVTDHILGLVDMKAVDHARG